MGKLERLFQPVGDGHPALTSGDVPGFVHKPFDSDRFCPKGKKLSKWGLGDWQMGKDGVFYQKLPKR